MDSKRIDSSDPRPLKLFFEDEASFGRLGYCSKCWVPAGERATIKKQQIREYMYAFTCVCPETGETYSIISPVCNTESMEFLLKQTSEYYSHYRILMVVDKAAWHTTQKLNLPENIELISLPPASPELNPVEHIWDYVREQKKFKNHSFPTLDAVENQLEIALNELTNECDYLKSLCEFSWIKDINLANI
jgi:transposase